MTTTLPTLDGLSFDEHNGLTRALVATPEATATVYLHGAHLTAWQPAGAKPVIFLSGKSAFAAEKPIRGGIPVVFPWFGPDTKGRAGGEAGPMHGFARLQEWAMTGAERDGGDVVLTFRLGPSVLSRLVGFDHFAVELEHRIGKTLATRMTVTNQGEEAMTFEQALHTYYEVADIEQVRVAGLEATGYIDKMDDFAVKPAAGEAIAFTGPVDRVYQGTTAVCTITDGGNARTIVTRKTGSETTVVWNPWKEMPDLAAEAWRTMVAVETANVGVRAVTLAPGASHTMEAVVSLG